MRGDFLPRDVGGLGRLVPFLTSVFAVLLSVMPVHVPGLTMATPAFALMAVYQWTLYRPDLLPPSGVFAIGLLLDLLNGTPYLGISSLTLLVARTLVLSQRRVLVKQPFATVWAGFMIVAGIIVLIEWLATSLLSTVALGTRPFIFQAIVTTAMFPVVSYLLSQTQRALLRRV